MSRGMNDRLSAGMNLVLGMAFAASSLYCCYDASSKEDLGAQKQSEKRRGEATIFAVASLASVLSYVRKSKPKL